MNDQSHNQIDPHGPKAIELAGVSFGYGGRPVLEEVNLAVEQGDFVAVVGPNGGGKTTLLKLILGLIAPQRGSVRLLGRSPRQARAQVGYMPQQSSLDRAFPITVLGAVLMGRLGNRPGFWRGADRQAAHLALEQVGLAALAQRPLADLSGGQRQRALVARALVGEPRLLLLDEPTSNVDVQAEEEFYDLLLRLNQRMTIVVVTHDLGFVSPYVRHVVCVNRQVLIHPTSDVTGEVISQIYGGPVNMVRHDHKKNGGCFHG